MSIARGRPKLNGIVAGLAVLAISSSSIAAHARGAAPESRSRRPSSSIVTTASVTVAGPVTTVAKRDWYDRLQTIAVLAALGSAILIWRQLVGGARAARQDRAAEAGRVWSDRKFLSIMSPVWEFLEVRNAEDCLVKARAWLSAPDSEDLSLPGEGGRPIARRNDVKYVVGVIEDVAVRYNRKEIDREWVERMLAPSLVDTFAAWLWFVALSRVTENWESWGAEWEAMVQDLRAACRASRGSGHVVENARDRRKRRRQRKQGIYVEIARAAPPPVRIICLPPGLGRASDEAWRQASQLSLALAMQEEAQGLAGVPEPSADSTRPSGWRTVVVPRTIDPTEADRQGDRQLSAKLDCYLGSLASVDDAIRSFANPGSTESSPRSPL